MSSSHAQALLEMGCRENGMSSDGRGTCWLIPGDNGSFVASLVDGKLKIIGVVASLIDDEQRDTEGYPKGESPL